MRSEDFGNFMQFFVREIDWLNRLAVKTRPQGFGSSGIYLLAGRYSLRCDDGFIVAGSDESCRAMCDAAGSLWVDGGQVKAGVNQLRRFCLLKVLGALEIWKFLKHLFELPDGFF